MKERYIDREQSWLQFNQRVLFQTERKVIPIIEKLKFLGITFSNLDEFISVRFSDVYEKYVSDYSEPDDIGNTNYKKKYKSLLHSLVKFKESQQNTFIRLNKELRHEKIKIESFQHLSKKEQKRLNHYFDNEIEPVLSPILYSNRKELPVFRDNELNFLIQLKDVDKKFCFLPIPSDLGRLIKLDRDRYIFIEDIIGKNLYKLFQNVKIKRQGIFTVSKECLDADIEDEKRPISDTIRDLMSSRDHSKIVFIDTFAMGKKLRRTLIKIFHLPKKHLFDSMARIDLSCLAGKPIRRKELEFPAAKIEYPPELAGIKSLFDYIDKSDVLLHHPYESYDVIVDFLREAASDKNVLSIKQTLYRVSSEESPIVKALCKAANNGIKVTVMLELLARFDEKRNLNLIDKLKAAGVSIVYSLENLKTHCKMILVTKKTKKGLHQYSYMATGNFNEKTARLYTDISLFTSSKKFGKDLNTVFNTLTGYSKPNHLEIISVAPNTLRDRLYELIKFEMEEAKKNKKALIKIKVNSICDLGIMDMLKKASRAGVKIQILCRGICSIKPDENIAIYSIIGKNLEHSRIYEFYHAGAWKRFISSADLLGRNLDKRIELLIPVKDKDCGKKLNKIFNRIYRKDTFNKFVMKSNGKYKFLNGKVDTQK